MSEKPLSPEQLTELKDHLEKTSKKLNTELFLIKENYKAGLITRQKAEEQAAQNKKRRVFLYDYTNMKLKLSEKRADNQDAPADMLVDEILNDSLPKLDPHDSRRVSYGWEKGDTNGDKRITESSGENPSSEG